VRCSRRSWDGAAPERLAAELRRGAPEPEGIAAAVAETIARVREGGDAALIELGERFDGVAPRSLRVDDALLREAAESIPAPLRDALERAAVNIRAVAEAQLTTEPAAPVLPQGQAISVREVPVGTAAIYAPAGRSPYPSSVLMGVLPARVAGVERVFVASPPVADGFPDRAVLAAAHLAGAAGAYAIGGAQGIAALAYGTESVEPVDVIAGPGSPWVQEAKLQVSRAVGIDGYAGPSELMTISDADSDPSWLALDHCAQAEHGEDCMLVAASTSAELLDRLEVEVERLAADRPSSADAHLDLVEVPGLDSAAALAQSLAPEHLQIDCRDEDALAARVSTAGCIFVGRFAATAFGDYAAGSNHVLPTGGAGRFTGPLGPATFRRRISCVELGADAAAALAGTVDAIARSEGFPVHGESALVRGGGSGPIEQAS